MFLNVIALFQKNFKNSNKSKPNLLKQPYTTMHPELAPIHLHFSFL